MTKSNWRIPAEQRAINGEVEMFCDRTSARSGEKIGVHISGQGSVNLTVWRLGHEGGNGGRLVADLGVVEAVPATPPVFESETGLVSCSHWPALCTFTVDPNWKSGVYMVRADTLSQPTRSTDAIFVVTPTKIHDIIVIIPVTTWVAYNGWGGRSLYDGGGFTGLPRAHAVSFDRPMKPVGSPIWELNQGHPFFTWEYPLIRWLESELFDIGYVTNLEVGRGELPAKSLIISAGHDEYWSSAMRDTLDLSLAAGRSLFWAGANGMCWNIRLTATNLGEDRTLTCWKDHLSDPIMASEPKATTGRWGEWPLYRSESDTIGLRWVDWDFSLNRRPATWIAKNTDHPIFEGTELRDGDRVPGIVGDEWDALDPSSPMANHGVVIGETECLMGANLGPSRGHSYMFRADGGGLVLATGTTSWAWGLDASTLEDRETAADPRLQALTRNFINATLSGCDW